MSLVDEKSNLYDYDLERAILSALINNEEAFGEISHMITPEDFHLQGHKEVYQAIISCVNNNEPIGLAFIKKYLGSRYNEQILVDIIATGSLIDTPCYAKELREKSIRRELMKIAHKIPAAITEPIEAKDIVDKISSEIYSLIENEQTGKIKSAHEIVIELAKQMKDLAERENNELIGLDTGFSYLNHLTRGFKPGELIILAARPSMGKTTLAGNFMQAALNAGKGVVMFSLEMSAVDIMKRMLSSYTAINQTEIINASFANNDDWTRFGDACEEMTKKKFWVHDSGFVTINQIRTSLRKLKVKHDEISLCVIDYIGLMTSASQFSDRHLQIAEISRGLKLLARELQIPIIALSQLNRNLEARTNKRPMLSDLRESGAIEQDADIILFVYRDDVYAEIAENERRQAWINAGKDINEYRPQYQPNPNEAEAEIIIGKNRNGGLGTIKVAFQKNISRFCETHSTPVETAEFQG